MAPARLARFLRRLRTDRSGASILETTLIAPVLVALACGATDMAMCYARKLALQGAASRVMEYAVAAGLNSNTFTTTLQNEGATAAGVSASNVTIDVWLECDGVRQSSYSGSCSGSTSPARYSSATISDTYNWMFSALWGLAGQPTTVPISGYAEVRIS